MPNEPEPQDQPLVYQIEVEGLLDPRWSGWFDGFRITYPDERRTLLVGSVQDQSALHGLLSRIRDLGLILLSVERRRN